MSDNKSILVLNDLDIWTGGEKSCQKCAFYSNILEGCILDSIINTGDIFDIKNCPIKPLPDLMSVESMRFPQSDGVHPSYKSGWNDAISTIAGLDKSQVTADYCKRCFKSLGEVYLSYKKDDVTHDYICGQCSCIKFHKYISPNNIIYYVCVCCGAVYKEIGND